MSKDLDNPEIVYRGSLPVSHCTRITSGEEEREAKDFASRPNPLTVTEARPGAVLGWDATIRVALFWGGAACEPQHVIPLLKECSQ